MKSYKIYLLSIIILSLLFAPGCWNYREIDKLAIVSGVAIDKENDDYTLTVEILKITSGKDSKTTSEIVSMKGRTIFDAARNQILLSGKRLYWSHTKVIIISKSLASEGITKVIDWYNRDSETRPDIHIAIANTNTAREIFTGQSTTENVKSFELYDMINSERSLSKAPIMELWEFVNHLQSKGVAATAPLIDLKKSDSKLVPSIAGTAVFKNDKFIDSLNEDDTKNALFVRNQIRGGVLAIKKAATDTRVSLEIFKNKTQITPIIKNDNVEMNINIETTVAIDELQGSENLIDEEGRKKLEEEASEYLKSQIENTIKKVQADYGSDIFGFGEKLRNSHNKVWKNYSKDWDNSFKNIAVNVNAKVHIRNSAMMSKPLKAGD